MTFAGHWPFQWLPIYQKQVELKGKEKDPDLEEAERHLNVNKIASQVLASVVAQIRKDDPEALIVISGDHLPALATRFSAKETLLDDVTDWHYYQTPLVILDPVQPDLKNLPAAIPAHSLGAEILSRLKIPESEQAHFPWFRSNFVTDSLQNGGTLVGSPGSSDYEVCTAQSSEKSCRDVYAWLHDVHMVGLDLVTGSQHATKVFHSHL
jgi:hypothetical protein